MTVPARPESAVSAATGLAGLAALALSTIGCGVAGVPAGYAVLVILPATAAAMVLWSVLAERVHRRASTGMDFARPRPWPEVWALTRVKFIGLGATFALIALAYATLAPYADAGFDYYFMLLGWLGPAAFVLGAPYIALTTRYMTEPRDGLWHFGRFVSGRPEQADAGMLKEHARAWTIKAFFLAFMGTLVGGSTANMLAFDAAAVFADPARLAIFLIQAMYFVDIMFGAIGYVMTLRVLDSHIRSSNPLLGGWVAALACYPPFALMGSLLDYHEGGREWLGWLAGHDALIVLCALPVLGLTAIYAWATVAFGFRFSNLTHRGILTNGPFRFTKHPAYLAKNVSWWLIFMPFLNTMGPSQAISNCLMLLCVNAVYFLRAKTEEKHLMADPRYRAYAAWMERHGMFAGARRALRGAAGSLAPGGQPGHAAE